MFLAFFPMLLLVMGIVAGSTAFRLGVTEIIVRLRIVLPPGAQVIFTNLLGRHNAHPWQLVSLGFGGTLLAGTQMMKLLMEGFRRVQGEEGKLDFLTSHLRALLLLMATIIPSILTVNLVVFGRQVRDWMLHTSSMPVLIRLAWGGVYVVASLLIALLVLCVVFRIGVAGRSRWEDLVPGAAIATVMWWVVSISLGFYLRHVPYSLVYGGLAVTIGFMIWMQLTATIVLIGAAYNAELLESRYLTLVPERSRLTSSEFGHGRQR